MPYETVQDIQAARQAQYRFYTETIATLQTMFNDLPPSEVYDDSGHYLRHAIHALKMLRSNLRLDEKETH